MNSPDFDVVVVLSSTSEVSSGVKETTALSMTDPVAASLMVPESIPAFSVSTQTVIGTNQRSLHQAQKHKQHV